MSPRTARWLPVVIAVALTAVLIGASLLSTGAGRGRGPSVARERGEPVAGTRLVAGWLAGVRTQGPIAGAPTAPVRVEEYVDPQCPFCRGLVFRELPDLLQGPVRAGRVQVRLRVLTFLGPDSERLARDAWAAAPGDRFWPELLLAYVNQGDEGTGWATDELRARLLRAAGAPTAPVTDTPVIDRALQADRQAAQAAGVKATPTVVVTGPRGRRQLHGTISPHAVSDAIADVA